MTPNEPELCTVGQAAEALNISTRAVLHRIQKGQIAAQKLGTGQTSAYVISRAEVDRVKAEAAA